MEKESSNSSDSVITIEGLDKTNSRFESINHTIPSDMPNSIEETDLTNFQTDECLDGILQNEIVKE